MQLLIWSGALVTLARCGRAGLYVGVKVGRGPARGARMIPRLLKARIQKIAAGDPGGAIRLGDRADDGGDRHHPELSRSATIAVATGSNPETLPVFHHLAFSKV